MATPMTRKTSPTSRIKTFTRDSWAFKVKLAMLGVWHVIKFFP